MPNVIVVEHADEPKVFRPDYAGSGPAGSLRPDLVNASRVITRKTNKGKSLIKRKQRTHNRILTTFNNI